MRLLPALLLALSAILSALPQPARADWQATLDAARGQTVYWHAWAGDERTNAFIAWVGQQTEARHGVSVRHVKLSDTAEAVSRVVAERAAGADQNGAVDLIWINGPNLKAMRDAGLLHGPFAADLPNARFLDLAPGAAAATDFTLPVDGFASAWRLARFVMAHDSARLPDPPRSMATLGAWAAANPGRMTHPDPANFMGATFLKQAMVELAPDPAALALPPDDTTFAAATAPLWAWYDALRPHLWRGGTTFPANESVQFQLLNDGEVDIAMAFDPAAPAALIEQGLLPETVRVFVPDGGTIGNVSFVAIPYNAAHAAGARVVANFLLDPATQARMQDITVLGSFSVLDPARMDTGASAAFAALPTAPALPTLADLGPTLPEPHPDWMTRLSAEWARRYQQ
jgi:putative thiamine transport system substrate-binding protein